MPTYEPLLAALDSSAPACAGSGAASRTAIAWISTRSSRACSDRVRLVVLTNPHNPSGVLLPPDEIAGSAGSPRRPAPWLLVDEVYRDIWFDEAPPSHVHLGPHSCRHQQPDQELRPLGAALRLGPLRAGPRRPDPRLTQDFMEAVDSVPSDTLAVAAFRQLPRLAERSRAILDPNLAAGPRLPGRAPRVARLRRPAALDDGLPPPPERGGQRALHDWLRGRETSIVPGRFFEAPRHFRLGFAVSRRTWPGV